MRAMMRSIISSGNPRFGIRIPYPRLDFAAEILERRADRLSTRD